MFRSFSFSFSFLTHSLTPFSYTHTTLFSFFYCSLPFFFSFFFLSLLSFFSLFLSFSHLIVSNVCLYHLFLLSLVFVFCFCFCYIGPSLSVTASRKSVSANVRLLASSRSFFRYIYLLVQDSLAECFTSPVITNSCRISFPPTRHRCQLLLPHLLLFLLSATTTTSSLRRRRIKRKVQRQTQTKTIRPHNIFPHLARHTTASAVQPPVRRQLGRQCHCCLVIRANTGLPRSNATAGLKRQRQSGGQTLHGSQ
jgi:hypothetical protein